LFEAGGLNKGLNKSRVCPLLLDLDVKELDSPLKEFNLTGPDKENMLALCKMINRQNTGNTFTEPHLEKFFNKFWPDFDSRFAALLKKHGESKPPEKKGVPEMVEQILETVQALLRASQSKSLPPGLLGSGCLPYLVVTEPSAQMPAGGYTVHSVEPKLMPPNVRFSSDELSKMLAQSLEWLKAVNPEPSEPEQPSSKPPGA
jgi:hypothetical protein